MCLYDLIGTQLHNKSDYDYLQWHLAICLLSRQICLYVYPLIKATNYLVSLYNCRS